MTFPIKQSHPAEKQKRATPVDSSAAYRTKGQSRDERHCESVCGYFRQGKFSHLTLSLICHRPARKACAIRHPNHVFPSGGTLQIAFREHSTVQAHHTWSCIAQYDLVSLPSLSQGPGRRKHLRRSQGLNYTGRFSMAEQLHGYETIQIIMGHLKHVNAVSLRYGCILTR